MSKPIYKPEPMYKSDINDMVEDLSKGGPGSGKRGHTTMRREIPLPKDHGKTSGPEHNIANYTKYSSDDHYDAQEHHLDQAESAKDPYTKKLHTLRAKYHDAAARPGNSDKATKYSMQIADHVSKKS